MASESSEWRIIALQTAVCESPKAALTHLTDFDQNIMVPYPVFVLERENEKIIVDTSFESVERSIEVAGEEPIVREDQNIEVLLEQIGLDPAEVRIGVNTHLHYDHCGRNHLFPNAKFYVQRDELRYAFVPNPGEEAVYFSPIIGEKPSFWGTAFQIIDGDMAIADGVSLIKVPGHTAGSQAVLIDTQEGIYCIAGDAAYLNENIEKGIPNGLHTSIDDWYRSVHRIKQLSDYILLSHEPTIFPDGPITRYPGGPAFATNRYRGAIQ